MFRSGAASSPSHTNVMCEDPRFVDPCGHMIIPYCLCFSDKFKFIGSHTKNRSLVPSPSHRSLFDLLWCLLTVQCLVVYSTASDTVGDTVGDTETNQKLGQVGRQPGNEAKNLIHCIEPYARPNGLHL